MYRGHTVAVVVPAYNEAGFVGDVLETVPEFVDRVYVVDDASTDDTWTEIQAHVGTVQHREAQTVTDGGAAGLGRHVVPIRHEENRGVGGSIKTGYQHALADGIDVTAVMNGDGQMDPARLECLLDPIVEGEADYAKGNRLVFESHRDGMSGWRFFGNALLTCLTKVASGYWKTMDAQNGYTAISRDALEAMELPDLYEDYGFLNDLLVRLNTHDVRVADVTMPAMYGEEESSIRYRRFVPGLSALLLRDFLWRLKVKYLLFDFHPLVLFYALGVAGVGLGSLIVAWAAVAATVTPETGALALLAVLLGVMCVGFAMLFDMRQNDHLEVQVRE